jgi:chromosomal replication initiator protein
MSPAGVIVRSEAGGGSGVNAKQLWQAALERVRTRVSAASYTTWFKATEAIELRPDALVVGVPNSFAREHLRQRFHELATNAVGDVLGRPLAVAFVVSGRRPASDRQGGDAEDPAGADVLPPALEPALLPTFSMPARLPERPLHAGRGVASRPAARVTRHERRATLDPPRAPAATANGRARAPHPNQPPLLALPATPAPHPLTRTSAGPATARAREVAPDVAPISAFGADPQARYVFESFVVGTANQLAYAAAQQVAAAPGQSYNPLFIYGGTGMGKTHLLLAIGHVARRQGLTVCYVPAERFANDIIEAIRHHTTEEFRARYRRVDVLLVDDIQFIAGKESTEEEFFHTFNTLHDANRQIVLSSDRTPRAMHHLQDRLRSRFEWGLIADIQPPGAEHRLQILHAKAASLGLKVPEEVLARLARPDCASVRELEGSLNRVLAYAETLRQPLGVELVDRALAPLRAVGAREVASAEVLATVARHYAVTLEALRARGRDRAIAWPRQVAMYLLREETPASLFQIGKELGGRDHTTVMHGCAHVSSEIASKDHVRREVEALRGELHGD